MLELVGSGTTVLFVSHNIDQICEMCGRVIWLEHERMKDIRQANKACAEYKGVVIMTNSLNEKKYYAMVLLLTLGFFAIWCFINADLKIENLLNYDEMASIKFAMSGDNIFGKIRGIIQDDPTNVPLFYVLLFIWIKLFGYKPVVMRLLPQIIAALSVYVIGLIGFKLKNKRLGIISILIAGVSIQIMYSSFQLRAYSLLVLGSAFLLLTYLDRQKSLLTRLKYLIALYFLSFAHFFGVLLCFTFGLWDVINVCTKKISFKELLIYIVYAAGFFPYLAISYFFARNKYSAFWPPVPDYLDLIEMFADLCPLETLGMTILFSTIALTCICILRQARHKTSFAIPENIKMSTWNIMAVILIGFFYSRYFDPSRSVWVYRYFLVVFPFIIVVLASAIEWFIAFFDNKGINKDVKTAILVGISIVLLYNNIEYAMQNPYEINTGSNFYTVAEYLRNNEDTNKPTTLIYFPYGAEYFYGWVNFYTEGGKYTMPNILCTQEELYQEDLSKYETIYTIGLVFGYQAVGDAYIESGFNLVDSNCGGEANLYRYERK